VCCEPLNARDYAAEILCSTVSGKFNDQQRKQYRSRLAQNSDQPCITLYPVLPAAELDT
jgi:hypothetical protein